MLRAFILTTRKLLVPRPLPSHTLTSDVTSSASTESGDVRRNKQIAEDHRFVLPLITGGHPLLGRNTLLLSNIQRSSEKRGIHIPNPGLIACNMINMLKCVDLAYLKDAPPPSFWLAMAVGKTQFFIPLLEIIGGYCNTMTIFQLHLAAMTVGFLGGMKWGLAISKSAVPQPTWDTMKWVVTPTIVAMVGLILPYPLGFLAVAGAMLSTLYLDLKSCALPPWATAIRLYLTVTTLAGLLMAWLAYLLFHNKANEAKKKEEKANKKKKKDVVEEEEDEDDDDEDEEEDKQKNGMKKNGKNGKNKKD